MLDTCVCVQYLRERASLKQMPPSHATWLSAIVTAELRTGMAKHPDDDARRVKLEDFLSIFEIRPFDDGAAQAYAEIRASLEKRGTPIGAMDMLIAAHARSLSATLITLNTREFSRVKGLSLLQF